MPDSQVQHEVKGWERLYPWGAEGDALLCYCPSICVTLEPCSFFKCPSLFHCSDIKIIAANLYVTCYFCVNCCSIQGDMLSFAWRQFIEYFQNAILWCLDFVSDVAWLAKLFIYPCGITFWWVTILIDALCYILMLKVIMLIAGCGHSKEACSNHWHFCGSPPQEQIPRGTAGQCPEAQDIQGQAGYLPKARSQGQGMGSDLFRN